MGNQKPIWKIPVEPELLVEAARESDTSQASRCSIRVLAPGLEPSNDSNMNQYSKSVEK